MCLYSVEKWLFRKSTASSPERISSVSWKRPVIVSWDCESWMNCATAISSAWLNESTATTPWVSAQGMHSEPAMAQSCWGNMFRQENQRVRLAYLIAGECWQPLQARLALVWHFVQPGDQFHSCLRETPFQSCHSLSDELGWRLVRRLVMYREALLLPELYWQAAALWLWTRHHAGLQGL